MLELTRLGISPKCSTVRARSNGNGDWSVKQITTVSSEIPHDVHDDQYDLYHLSATSKPSPLQVSLEVERQNVML